MKDDDLLNSWKEIAAYLGTSTKTARRWEISNNLPIHHQEHRRKSSVFASKRALDGWVKGTLTNIVFEDDRLIALGISGKILWTHRFPAPLRKFAEADLPWRLQRVDFHGAGDRGVLVSVGYDGFQLPDSIHYFSSTGNLEWTVAATPPLLDRNGTSFEQAWAIRHTIITPEGPGYITWAALANEAGWAGCVLRVDSHRKCSVHFANAGYVERLCDVRIKEDHLLIASGENNDFDQAFISIFSTAGPAAISPPGNRPRYRYKNAPSGSTRKYVLFPLTELVAARRAPYGHVMMLRQFQDHVIVDVETAGGAAFFLYHFSNSLEPKYVFPSGSHEFAHDELASVGRLDHQWNACREMDRPLILNVWEPTKGWRDELIQWRDNPWRDK